VAQLDEGRGWGEHFSGRGILRVQCRADFSNIGTADMNWELSRLLGASAVAE
jgi:hypothetical protein